MAIRAITGIDLPQDREMALALEHNEILRVLLIFAEIEGGNPLAARLEREKLLTLFYEQILPRHLVQIDTLCYGVTRATIEGSSAGGDGLSYCPLEWAWSS